MPWSPIAAQTRGIAASSNTTATIGCASWRARCDSCPSARPSILFVARRKSCQPTFRFGSEATGPSQARRLVLYLDRSQVDSCAGPAVAQHGADGLRPRRPRGRIEAHVEGSGAVHQERQSVHLDDPDRRVAVGIVDDRREPELLAGGRGIVVDHDGGRSVVRRRWTFHRRDGRLAGPPLEGVALPTGERRARLGRHAGPGIALLNYQVRLDLRRRQRRSRQDQAGLERPGGLPADVFGHVVEIETVPGARRRGGPTVAAVAFPTENRCDVRPGGILRLCRRRAAPNQAADETQLAQETPGTPEAQANGIWKSSCHALLPSSPRSGPRPRRLAYVPHPIRPPSPRRSPPRRSPSRRAPPRPPPPRRSDSWRPTGTPRSISTFRSGGCRLRAAGDRAACAGRRARAAC